MLTKSDPGQLEEVQVGPEVVQGEQKWSKVGLEVIQGGLEITNDRPEEVYKCWKDKHYTLYIGE